MDFTIGAKRLASNRELRLRAEIALKQRSDSAKIGGTQCLNAK